MIKQIVLIILLTVVAILFKDQLSQVLDSIVYVHNYIANLLHIIFSDDNVGLLIQDMIALLLIPIVCGLVVASVYWLIKRGKMPHTATVIWVVWLILLVTMVAQNSIVTTKMARQTKASLHASAHYD